MGAGEGSGCRRGGGRRRAGAHRARRARQNRQRRARAHHRNHHRAGAGHRGRHGQRGHHGIHLFFGGIGARGMGRRQGRGHRTTTGTRSASGTATSGQQGSGLCSSLPTWVAPLVISLFLVTLAVVAFAVPAVPFPLGITATMFFILLIVVPLVCNIVQTRNALAREGPEVDVEAGEARPEAGEARPEAGEAGPWADQAGPGATVFWREIFGGPVDQPTAESATITELHDETTPRYAYDLPPSFDEATTAQPASSPGEGLRPEPSAPPAPRYGETLGAEGMFVPPAVEEDSSGRQTPPPPSYEEAVGLKPPEQPEVN